MAELLTTFIAGLAAAAAVWQAWEARRSARDAEASSKTATSAAEAATRHADAASRATEVAERSHKTQIVQELRALRSAIRQAISVCTATLARVEGAMDEVDKRVYERMMPELASEIEKTPISINTEFNFLRRQFADHVRRAHSGFLSSVDRGHRIDDEWFPGSGELLGKISGDGILLLGQIDSLADQYEGELELSPGTATFKFGNTKIGH